MINIDSSTQRQHAQHLQKGSKAEKLEEIKQAHKESQSKQFARMMSEVQSLVQEKVQKSDIELEYQEFQEFLKNIEYEGKPIASLSEEEAAELVSDDGFFGIPQTSERIAQFVIHGAAGDEALLREGRKGILQGFKEAEEIWGGKLPDIAYETIEKAVEILDDLMAEKGYSVIDEKV